MVFIWRLEAIQNYFRALNIFISKNWDNFLPRFHLAYLKKSLLTSLVLLNYPVQNRKVDQTNQMPIKYHLHNFSKPLFGSAVLLFSSFLNGFTIFSSVRMTNPWIHGLLSFSFQMGSSTQPPSQTFREAIPWFIRSPWGRCKLIQNISTVSFLLL